MDRYLLHYFLAVVETGNFSRAAMRLNVAQPTLSVGIAKLEAQLGAKLFHRTNRRVHLTDAGSRFLLRARRIEHEFNLAVDELSALGGGRLIRFGFLATIPVGCLDRIVTVHRRRSLSDQLEILEGSEREIANLLDRGRIDLALTIVRPGADPARHDLLREERYVLVAPRNHRLAESRAVTAADLAGEPMILRRHCEALSETSRYFTERNIRPLFAHQSVNDDRAVAMVRAGLGVTVMPESYLESAIVRLPLKDFDLSRSIGIAFADHACELRAMRGAFPDLLRETLTSGAAFAS